MAAIQNCSQECIDRRCIDCLQVCVDVCVRMHVCLFEMSLLLVPVHMQGSYAIDVIFSTSAGMRRLNNENAFWAMLWVL